MLRPRELEAWLVAAGLAVPNGTPGMLVPTARAYAIGGSLDFIRG